MNATKAFEQDAPATVASPLASPARRASGPLRWLAGLSPSNISIVYALIAVIVIFGALRPSTFLTFQTFKLILDQSTVGGLLALALVIPLMCGTFDLSLGYTMGATGVFVAWLLGNTGLPNVVVVVLGLAFGATIGLFNAFVVVVLGIEPIIATLASGSLIYAATLGISHSQQMTAGIDSSFTRLVATADFNGFTVPVFIFLFVMLAIGFVSARRTLGRYWYAVGFDIDTARLSGLRVDSLRTGSLVVGGVLSATAGICLVGSVGVASPDAGPSYLLPGFAAVFLGATQVVRNRFNAWGTALSVLFLGTTTEGLVLARGPLWLPQAFEGAALIVAVALANGQAAADFRRTARASIRQVHARIRTRPVETKK